MAELKIISMDEVQSKEVNWLWYPYIPYGKITIIQGDPGEGKTTLALRLAALLSKGEALPYDDTEREPVKNYLSNGRGRTGRYHQAETGSR